MAEKKLRVFKLRNQTEGELTKELDVLKQELNQLRVAKVAGGAPSKLGKIKVVRKRIAKYLTVINQNAKNRVRKETENKKYKPRDVRAKKTRDLRRRLTRKQLNLRTRREQKRASNFPLRKFALRE